MFPGRHNPRVRQRIAAHFYEDVQYNQALGMELLSIDPDPVHAKIAYRESFLGDVAGGLWHTSVATALADAVCGLTTLLSLPEGDMVATLDLRMDYLRPAVAEIDLYAMAELQHLTRSVAFTRATLYQQDGERPTALCTAAFMRIGGSSQ